MADVSWTLGLSGGDETADRLLGGRGTDGWPILRPGATERVRFGWDVGNRSTYETVRDYARLASPRAVVTKNGLDTTPFYRELHDDSKDLLVSFDPTGSSFNSDVDGWWGVLVGGGELTNPVRTRYGLELEVFVLAELSAYGTRSAAEDVHEK